MAAGAGPARPAPALRRVVRGAGWTVLAEWHELATGAQLRVVDGRGGEVWLEGAAAVDVAAWAAPGPGRRCLWCSEELSATATSRARYCSDEHRVLGWRAAARARRLLEQSQMAAAQRLVRRGRARVTQARIEAGESPY